MKKHVPKTNPTPIVTLLPNCRSPVTPSDPLVGGGEPVMFSLVEDTKAASCRTKSKKQLKEVEDAQLAAHRSQVVLQKVPSEANPKVRNHGEGPY